MCSISVWRRSTCNSKGQEIIKIVGFAIIEFLCSFLSIETPVTCFPPKISSSTFSFCLETLHTSIISHCLIWWQIKHFMLVGYQFLKGFSAENRAPSFHNVHWPQGSLSRVVHLGTPESGKKKNHVLSEIYCIDSRFSSCKQCSSQGNLNITRWAV